MQKQASLLPSVLKQAVEKTVADVIFTFGQPPIVKDREHGLLRLEGADMTKASLEALVHELLPSRKLKEFEEKLQTDFAYEWEGHRFRVNLFRQRGYPSLVMRYVQPNIKLLSEIGAPEVLEEMLKHETGLILLVGPTGSGKSTTLASMIEEINRVRRAHIVTIEDPIEYLFESKESVIEQREIGVDVADFGSGLRAVLREAPDVILLGEMRDRESISAAITVAETGHLVLSTIHANSSVATIDRILDTFPPEQKDQLRIQLADILVGVVNQRLVPRADGEGVELFAEVMLGTTAVKNAIRTSNSAQLPTVIQTSKKEGMALLDDLLADAVYRGRITRDAALAHAADRDELRKQFGSI